MYNFHFWTASTQTCNWADCNASWTRTRDLGFRTCRSYCLKALLLRSYKYCKCACENENRPHEIQAGQVVALTQGWREGIHQACQLHWIQHEIECLEKHTFSWIPAMPMHFWVNTDYLLRFLPFSIWMHAIWLDNLPNYACKVQYEFQ